MKPWDLRWIVVFVAVAVAIGVALPQVGPVLTLAGIGAVALLVAGFLQPDLTTLLALFALYANLPVVAVKYHGVPVFAAVAPLLLLGIPLVFRVVGRREGVVVDAVLRRMLVFLGLLLLSAALARDRGLALQWIGTYVLEGLAIYFAVINVVRDRQTVRRVLWTLLLAGAFMAGACVYSDLTRSYDSELGGLVQRKTAPDERAGPQTLARDRLEGKLSTSRRAAGPIGEINRFAQILLVLLPLAFFLYRGERQAVARAAAAALGGVILAGFLLTYSRSGFLVFAGLLVLLALIGHVRPLQLAAAAAAVLALVLVAAPGYLARVQSIADVSSLLSGGNAAEADGATRGRVTEMLAGFGAFVDHPLLGVGPGQYQPFYSSSYQIASEHALRYIPQPRRAHSLYIELAAETGLAGLMAFLAIVAVPLRRLWRNARNHTDRLASNVNLACWYALVAYLGMGVFLHLAFQRYFWLLLAVAGAAMRVERPALAEELGSPSPAQRLEPLGWADPEPMREGG